MYLSYFETGTALNREKYLNWDVYENMAPYETGFIVSIFKRDMEERKKQSK